MIAALLLPALLAAAAPPSFDIKYMCDEAADKKRLCVVSEEQLEGLLKNNNAVTAKLREIQESHACIYNQVSLKVAK